MSTVSGSGGSSRQDDVVRQQREDHLQKESQSVKKHNKELRRLNEAHQKEMEKVKNSHKEQIESFKNQTRKQISTREMKHQQEMDKLRNFYRNQYQSQLNELNEKMENYKEVKNKDSDTFKANKDARLQALNEHYRESLLAKDERSRMEIEDMRKTQRETIARNRENIENEYLSKMGSLKESHSKSLVDLQNKYNALQGSSSARLKGQEIQHFQDKKRMSDNLIDTVRRERLEHQDVLSAQREGFQGSLEKLSDRYEQSLEKERDVISQARDGMRSSVEGRVNNQLRQLEKQVGDLKAINTRKETEIKRKSKNEIENFKRDYQKNLNDYQDKLNVAVKVYNESNSEDIKKVRKEMSDQLVSSARFYRREMANMEAKNKGSVDQLETDFEARVQQSKEQADNRVEKVRKDADLKVVRMKDFYDMREDSQKLNRADEVLEMRTKMDQERVKAVESLRKQVREIELKHENKVNSLTNEYEERIAKMNDNFLREKESNNVKNKRVVKTLIKQNENQLVSQRMQYEQKLAELNEKHKNELEKLNSRHHDQMDQMAVVIKKT